ncbi:hypothetical protein ATZ33_14725 [Enterococcus silesiacus]|uniref:Uncharacterized protein n=2 Tax=Enterococcus silesiacus TaxID=332949 RepID=A0ABM5WBZ0_9ENTE|nr:hypothetical protein [Enterococcus silesiacus]ALS02584.1 hypothetical protein ATZ33_14725 [Enterococcus silesiacus]
MSILDWLFILMLSSSVLFLFFGVICVVLSIRKQKRYTLLKSKRVKNKRKKQKIKRMLAKLKKQQKKNIRTSVFLFLLGALTLGGGMYARYYQQTNLETEDANAIIQSYFLVGEIEKDLQSLSEGSDPGKVNEKLTEMTSLLITYGNKNAFGGLSLDGQKKLNRYYALVREFGVNFSSRTLENLKDTAYVANYLEDITKIKKSQKQIFDVFKVNETALNQKK